MTRRAGGSIRTDQLSTRSRQGALPEQSESPGHECLALKCVPGRWAGAPPKPHPSWPGPEPSCPCAQRDIGFSNGPHALADLHPHRLYFLFMKRPGSRRPVTTLSSPFLYLSISKHLAKTFIFSLPQGEEVIRENGTNMPICQKQQGSELEGKSHHLSEQN